MLYNITMSNSPKYNIVIFGIGSKNSIKNLFRKKTILGKPTKISTPAANAMRTLVFNAFVSKGDMLLAFCRNTRNSTEP